MHRQRISIRRIFSEESLKELCTEENREELLGEAIALEDGTEIGDASEIQTLKSEEQETAEQNSSVTLDAPQKDSVVTGSVHAEADGYALFMIPYEKGWSLTIDGEKAELLRGDIGFLHVKCQREIIRSFLPSRHRD